MPNSIADKLAYFRTPKLQVLKKYASNRNPFKGENALSIEIANFLKAKTLEGEFNGVWTKIAHEASSNSLIYGVLMRNMGKNPGAADFIFTNSKNHLWLELKEKSSSKIQPSQVFFQNWCEEQQNNYFIVCSLKEAVEQLTKFGFLT